MAIAHPTTDAAAASDANSRVTSKPQCIFSQLAKPVSVSNVM